MKDVDPKKKAYWFRVGMGFLAAVLCFWLGAKDFEGLLLAIAVYVLSAFLIRYAFGISGEALEGKHKLWTEGIGAYVITWLFFWILLYTLFP